MQNTEANSETTYDLIHERIGLWVWVPGHFGQHSPGGVYELEQLSGGQGLLSHSTVPCWEEGMAVSAGLKVNTMDQQ